MQEKKITLKIHKKSRFQPNEKIFAESCSVRYKDLLGAKIFFGVIGTLSKIKSVTKVNSKQLLLRGNGTFTHVLVKSLREGNEKRESHDR